MGQDPSWVGMCTPKALLGMSTALQGSCGAGSAGWGGWLQCQHCMGVLACSRAEIPLGMTQPLQHCSLLCDGLRAQVRLCSPCLMAQLSRWEWHVPVLAFKVNRNLALWVLCHQSPFAKRPLLSG